MFKRIKNKYFKNLGELPKYHLDFFIYIYLIVFICICICFKFNFIMITLLALLFMVLILATYLFKTKIKNSFFIEDYANRIDKMTMEEIKKMVKEYYENLEYNVYETSSNLVIVRNDNKYRVVFLPKCNIKILSKIYKCSLYIKGTVIVTNTEIDKETRRYIKDNNYYSITRSGLANILQNQEFKKKQEEKKSQKYKNKEKEQ